MTRMTPEIYFKSACRAPGKPIPALTYLIMGKRKGVKSCRIAPLDPQIICRFWYCLIIHELAADKEAVHTFKPLSQCSASS